ncbi:MAG: carboxypeptidase regulatory-like domain-containing protein [Pyrinomonadaceae bacterium]|nr:carboxypeptidase regulatory-like domain-containing protein [Pyrinomonadaceae bacterium]
MTKQADSFDRLRIAAPCPASWEKMKGNEQVRFCEECNLNVYNLSGMTRRQAEAIVRQTEGRLCARFYRRADGTIITRDCPVGLRALRRRTARIVGAAATALMSFCLSAMGQQKTAPVVCEPDSGKPAIKRTKIEAATQVDFATFSGQLTDPNGAGIPGVKVTLINERTKKSLSVTSNEAGEFHFRLLEKGTYTLKVEKEYGFNSYERQQISVRAGEAARLDIALELDGTSVSVLVGAILTPDMIDTTRPGGTFTITSDMIQKLPYED